MVLKEIRESVLTIYPERGTSVEVRPEMISFVCGGDALNMVAVCHLFHSVLF